MSNIFVDKPRRNEIHKSLKSRLIVTSRKRLKLNKIKDIKKIKKKFHRIQKKNKNHEKYEENNNNKKKEEETIFNKSYPNILKEKENLNENHFIYKPIQKSNNIIIIETNDEGEPRIINNNIKNEPIKKVEDNNIIHNILNIKDNNSQQDNTNSANNNILNISNNIRENNNFDGFVPCEFNYGNLIEPFEGNSLSEDFTSHDSPFFPRTLSFNLDNHFNDFNLFSDYQEIYRFNNDKTDDYSHFSIPDTFSFNSSNNQNNTPNLNSNSNISNLGNIRDNGYLNNNFNNDYIYRNNNSYRHHFNFNNLNYNYNIFNYNINNNIINNRNNIIYNRNSNIFNNINIYYPNTGNNYFINNNILSNNRNNNVLNNNRSNNANNNSNILNRIRNRYYYPIERSLSYYGMGKIKINKIKEKLSKSKIKNVNNLEDNKKSCIICLEDFKNRQMIYSLPCQHIFHVNCLNKEIKLRQRCPICRKEMK